MKTEQIIKIFLKNESALTSTDKERDVILSTWKSDMNDEVKIISFVY